MGFNKKSENFIKIKKKKHREGKLAVIGKQKLKELKEQKREAVSGKRTAKHQRKMDHRARMAAAAEAPAAALVPHKVAKKIRKKASKGSKAPAADGEAEAMET